MYSQYPGDFKGGGGPALGGPRIEAAVFRSAWITFLGFLFSIGDGAGKSHTVMSAVRLAGFDGWSRCRARVGWVVLTLGGFEAGCGPAAPGFSRDVAAHSSRVPTRLALAARRDNPQPSTVGATVAPGGSRATKDSLKLRQTETSSSEHALPFRVQLVASDSPVPSLSRFGVGFAPVCISGGAKESVLGPPTVHVEGTFAVRGYELRVRYDAHTSRSLVLAKRGHTELGLSSLGNEWAALTPGVHELVLFARDARGVVPVTATGDLAYDVCRFSVSEAGRVKVLPGQRSEMVLLGPEGTRHGAAAEAAWVQVASKAPAANSGTAGGSEAAVSFGTAVNLGTAVLEVRRPDGGSEAHDITAGLFEVSPLQSGDYWFALATAPDRNRAQVGSDIERVLRLSVNRERPE